MKKMFICIFFVLLSVSSVSAHPPELTDVSLKRDTHTLHISAEHNVYDPAVHYIKEIRVSRNGKNIITDVFSEQKDASVFEKEYVIRGLEEGDVLAVDVSCNVFGSSRGMLTVGEEDRGDRE
jgi:hypothetical protein